MDTGKSIDFDRVAGYYDLHVTADFDLAFWIDQARRHPGERLELMCGTGRISLPILRAGLPLCCADYSEGLLTVLRGKLEREKLTAPLVHADARALPFEDRFDFIFIGFHAFAELSEREDQLAALRSIRKALREDGRFSLSLQNPLVRGPQLDGAWRDLGIFPMPSGDRRLEVRGRYLYDPATGLAEGTQTYRELASDGRCLVATELPVRFRLIAADEFEALAGQAGLRVEERFGGYAREDFQAKTSPFFIATLRA